MFEKYQFDGVYIAIQAVLTLYAQGEGKLLSSLLLLSALSLLMFHKIVS